MLGCHSVEIAKKKKRNSVTNLPGSHEDSKWHLGIFASRTQTSYKVSQKRPHGKTCDGQYNKLQRVEHH